MSTQTIFLNDLNINLLTSTAYRESIPTFFLTGCFIYSILIFLVDALSTFPYVENPWQLGWKEGNILVYNRQLLASLCCLMCVVLQVYIGSSICGTICLYCFYFVWYYWYQLSLFSVVLHVFTDYIMSGNARLYCFYYGWYCWYLLYLLCVVQHVSTVFIVCGTACLYFHYCVWYYMSLLYPLCVVIQKYITSFVWGTACIYCLMCVVLHRIVQFQVSCSWNWTWKISIPHYNKVHCQLKISET